MNAEAREPCRPVWIWSEGDWSHEAPQFGYVRYTEHKRLEQIFLTFVNLGFVFDYQVGLYGQEEADLHVPWPLVRFVELALAPYLDSENPDNGSEQRAEIDNILLNFDLRLAERHVEG